MSIIKLHYLHNLCKHFVHGLRLDNYLLLITSALSFHSGLKAIYLPHLTILGSKDVSVLVRLYKVYVRPLLESSIQVWNPWLHKDIKCIERVQRFFTSCHIQACWKTSGYDYTKKLSDLDVKEMISLLPDLQGVDLLELENYGSVERRRKAASLVDLASKAKTVHSTDFVQKFVDDNMAANGPKYPNLTFAQLDASN
eukprot:Em0583g3a